MRLTIEYVDINSIKTYENNAKLHPAEQINQIKRSIEEFGMNDPIGVHDGIIVEGHGRYIACLELGFTEIPVIRLDNLSDEQRKAYALVHNKLTMNSGFDLELLNDELNNISDIDMTGYGFIDTEVIDMDDFYEETNNEVTIICSHCGKEFIYNKKTKEVIK